LTVTTDTIALAFTALKNLLPHRVYERAIRSEIFRRIRSKDTSPERTVRRVLFSLGYRYRLHRSDLPGKPDIVFSGLRKVIFVHGCFRHPHEGCKTAHTPRANQAYWLPKLERNALRNAAVLMALRELGWMALVLRECEMDNEALKGRLREFLSDGK
jgi:DNA mismatch endonuclease (patch repair protein)